MKQIIITIEGNDIDVSREQGITDAEFYGVMASILNQHTMAMNLNVAMPLIQEMVESEVVRQSSQNVEIDSLAEGHQSTE